jgi:drug/metabolite transporter (DMT)-like permease
MEKRILGIILSILGIVGLIMAGVYFMNGSQGTKNMKAILLFAILGAIFFFAGISLVRNTKDKAT